MPRAREGRYVDPPDLMHNPAFARLDGAGRHHGGRPKITHKLNLSKMLVLGEHRRMKGGWAPNDRFAF
jgi:hypothetical protein